MWKTFLGRCIYQSKNGVEVFQNFLYRWLKFKGKAIQSLLNRYFPERPGLYYVNLLTLFVKLKPASCCMLGLGGAGIAHALSPFNIPLTVVESESEIIRVAQRFFMLDQLTNLEIIHGQAERFVNQTKQSYHHLLIDLFNAENFPPECNTEQFFSDCKERLLPNGILAVNLANIKEQWPIFELIRNNFSHCTLSVSVKKSANIVIFATKGKSIDHLVEMLKHHKKLKRLFWDTKWGNVAEVRD